MTERCFACGGIFDPEPGGTVHAYMLSTPGCWAAYGRLLAREYSDPALFNASHRLTVDAYALQHPGRADDPRAVQSVWLHAASLWLVLKLGTTHVFATSSLKAMIAKTPGALPEPPPQFAVTHAKVLANPIADHDACVRHWANATLEDWSELHGDLERLTGKIVA